MQSITIAEALNYNESYLYKVIKEDFPMTLNEYILQYRLKQAIDKMAESPNSPLSAISDQVGFSDYKYFAKVFKKHLHISPKELKLLGRIVK
ncbi:TPA: helix-turn-helix domain-containing protein [Streptococcus pneumoniae]